MRTVFQEGKERLEEFFIFEDIEFCDGMLNSILRFMSSILNYEEEGEKIKPNILIGNGTKTITQVIPNKYKLKIAQVTAKDNKFNKMLKRLIPFCKNDWYIYIDIDSQNDCIEYGVIRGFTGPKGLSIKEIIFDGTEYPDAAIVFIEAMNKFEVQLTGLKGGDLLLDYRILSEHVHDFNKVIEDFALDFVSSVGEQYKPELRKVISKLMKTAYKRIHGTICMIVKNEYSHKNQLTIDGVWFDEPIDLAKYAINLLSAHPTIDCTIYETYYALTGLFIEMLNTDGITVLDDKGRIRAYNVFVKPSQDLPDIAGGARKRAAYSVAYCNEPDVIGVFFQSQDGDVFYERVDIDE